MTDPMSYRDALADPKHAAQQIRDTARRFGAEHLLDGLVDRIPSAAVARRLVLTSKSDRIRQAAIVFLAENPDPLTN